MLKQRCKNSAKRPFSCVTGDPAQSTLPKWGCPFILVHSHRLGKFLNTDTDVEITTQPDFEDQTLDFSDVEQLMCSLHTLPGTCSPVRAPLCTLPAGSTP